MAIEIVDFPIKNGGSFHSYVKLPEGIFCFSWKPNSPDFHGKNQPFWQVSDVFRSPPHLRRFFQAFAQGLDQIFHLEKGEMDWYKHHHLPKPWYSWNIHGKSRKKVEVSSWENHL